MITYTVECLPEEIGVRGNAMASGDDAQDKEVEDQIIADLEGGNEWAWCSVKVTASLTIDGETFAGSDYLGCCSYASEVDFKNGGYFEDMQNAASEDLLTRLRAAYMRGCLARNALVAVGELPDTGEAGKIGFLG